jgi:hypothetical protein
MLMTVPATADQLSAAPPPASDRRRGLRYWRRKPNLDAGVAFLTYERVRDA